MLLPSGSILPYVTFQEEEYKRKARFLLIPALVTCSKEWLKNMPLKMAIVIAYTHSYIYIYAYTLLLSALARDY